MLFGGWRQKVQTQLADAASVCVTTEADNKAVESQFEAAWTLARR